MPGISNDRRPWASPHEHPVKSLLAGHYQTALIYVAAKLHLADHLAKRSHGHTELSQLLGVDPDSLFRLMRGLVVLGLLTETDDGRFGLADWGHVLRSDAPGSLHGRAILAGEEYMRASLELVHAARTGELPFRTAFGMDVWQHRKDNPHLNQHFNDEMDRSTTALIPHLLEVHDFSPYQTVVDIAGGQGLLLAEILAAFPHLNGVLFDQRHVIEHACRRPDGDQNRCTLLPGDMFESIPEGGDAYLLKRILHDWDDERSVTILRNCRRAMHPGSRLLIVEMVAPDRAMDAPEVVMTDLHMLTVTGGRERTAGEYRRLIHEAGLAWERLDSAGPLFSIIQAATQ